MKIYLDCYPCFLKQALKAARLSCDSEHQHREVLNQIALLIPKIHNDSTPPEIARIIYKSIIQITGHDNPFLDLKKKYTHIALEYYDYLKKKVDDAHDKIEMAIRVAIAGNIIDFGAVDDFDLKKEIDFALSADLARFDIDDFKKIHSKAKTILFIGDNAGETVFDRILIETLDRDTIFAVRDVPIINDAVIEDAEAAGLDKICKIISSGSDAPGTILEHTSDEFKQLFYDADMVIAKGMGNFESMSGLDRNIFFLLRAKCEMVARNIGCQKGDLICEYYRQ